MRQPSRAKIAEIKEHAAALAAKVRETGLHPEAPVVRKTENTWVIRCPFCQQEHSHGKGEGHRVPHCFIVSDMPGYLIVDRLDKPAG